MKKLFNDPSIITLVGRRPGPTVTIMAGVHGNEVGGILALRQVVRELIPERGVIFCILANLPAIALNIRQTQMNLNRAFVPAKLLSSEQLNSYERKRAEQLMPYLDRSEALLDLHSSATLNSPPFIIGAKQSYPVAQYLPLPIFSDGWDKIEPGSTDYYMNQQNKIGLCVECGYHLDRSAVTLATQSIYAFLGALKIMPPQPKIKAGPQQKIDVDYIYLTKNNFDPVKKFADFEAVTKNTIIGYDGQQAVRVSQDCLILFVRKKTKSREEAFITAKRKN